jgi:general secretion pathway protein D
MIHYRYALTAVALAGCQLAPIQAQQSVAEVPGTNLVTESAVPAKPGTQTRVKPSETADKGQAANAEPVSEPRIIRGNDRVVAPAKPSQPIDGTPVSFSFEEAPVADVVRTILGDILKTDYVLHPPLSGTVTLSTRAAIPPDRAVFLLESALQANGLALMRDARGSYHVGRPDALKGIGGAVRQAGGGPLPPGYGSIVVPLQYIGAAEMATILKPMMPADALVRVDNLRNLLVLAGTRTQAEGWLDLVNTFDVDLLKGMSVGVFPLKHASIKEVEAALRLVSGGGASAAATGTNSATSATALAAGGAGQTSLGESNPLFGALRIMPIERLNSILVVTPRAAYLDEARRWIERLDQPSDNGAEPQLFIYQVKNVNARHLASVLSGIFGGQSGTGSVANSGVSPGLTSATGSSMGQPVASNSLANTASSGLGLRSGGLLSGAGSNPGARTGGQTGATQPAVSANIGGVRVIADELNNSVLVWGSRSEYAKIETTLKRLDLPLTQVLIEASIIEVTLNDDLEYGLEWAFKDSRATTDYTGIGTLNAATSSRSPLTALGNGFSYALKNPAGNVTALLRALSTKTTVKVIASPSLMVLDNHAASIAVGTQTPIQSGTTSNLEGTVTTTNIQYKDTGVNLMVTPSVNSGNIVTMQVDQSVTDVGAKDEVTNQRAFLQRQLSSKVAVRSGESIVMGGLIQERGTTSKSGVPILHTLPVVGNLFGSTAKDGARTELIVVITPRVVRSDIDIREVSDDLRDRMKGLQTIDIRESDTERRATPAGEALSSPLRQ